MSYLAKLVKRLSLVWAIVVVGGACGDGPSGATAAGPTPTLDVIASVRVLPESLEVHVGESLRFTAEPRNARGQLLVSESIAWSTSDTTVALVDSSGALIALQAGEVQVLASSRDKFGSARVRIRPVPVASVTTTPSSASLAVGETLRIEARTYSPAGNRLFGRSVTWSTSAPGVATVDATGLVTAQAVGSALISARSEGRVGTSQVQVTGPTAVPVPGAVGDLSVVSVTDTTATLRFTEVTNGLGAAANYEIRFAVAPISWGAATVASRGSCAAPVVGSGVGLTRTCILRGLVPSTAYEFQLRAFRGTGADAVLGPESNVVGSTTNQVAVATVTLDPTSASTPVGQARSYTATVRDAAGNAILGRTLTWNSTSASVANVSSAGVATALAIGSTTIRASTGGRTGSASLSVTAAAQSPVATVVLAPGSDTVSVGQSATYQATLRDSAGSVLTGRPVAWSSTNTSVATVTGAGVVTGISTGSATIRATSEGLTGSATLLVVAAAPVQPPPGPLDPSLSTNLPPSMTLVTDNPWTGPLLSPTQQNWGFWRDPATNQLWELAMNRSQPNPVLTTDNSAPSADRSVLVQSYGGVTDGNEPRFPFLSWSAGNEVFISMWVKFHAQWRQPAHSGLKWNLVTDGNGFVGWFGLGPTTTGVEGHPNVRWTFQYNSCASGNCPESRDVLASPMSAGNLVRGQWNKVQYHVRKSPARIAIWVNDVLIVDKTDFTFASTSGIREIELGGTWGGGIGYTGPTNNVIWYDRVALWRRP